MFNRRSLAWAPVPEAWPIALLFIDLDHFKEINDTFGHPAGVLVLLRAIPWVSGESI